MKLQSATKYWHQLMQVFRPNLAIGMSFGFGLLNAMSFSAVAEDVVGNKGIRFDEDTMVEFEFIESHGAYQSTFGVIELDSCQATSMGEIIFESCSKTPLLSEVKPSDNFNMQDVYRQSSYQTNLLTNSSSDFVGTPGNTVPNYMAEYIFEADKIYVFYLESQFDDRPAGVVYTTNLINTKSNRQALFHKEDLSTQTVAQRRNNASSDVNQFDALTNGGLLVNFDDTGSALVKSSDEDNDFDDFVVGIGGCLCDPTKADTNAQSNEINR